MRNLAFLALAGGAAFLAACGSDPAPDPVDQIVIRNPGEQSQVAVIDNVPEAVDMVATGRSAFAVCTGCHSASAGEPSMAGPNLWGVVGRSAGSLDDFAYSQAMASSGITWTPSELDAFLAAPGVKVEGTSMVAGAVSDPDRRAAIIAYLATLSD